MLVGTCKGVAFPGREGIRMRKKSRKSRKDKIVELIVQVDKIHTENHGRVTADEIRLRVMIRVNLNVMSLTNKFTALKKFVCEKILMLFLIMFTNFYKNEK